MIELSAAARSLVDGPNNAHVATLLPDGAPHSVPVWVGLDGGRVVFFTDPRSRKGRNLARDPRVSISITDREHPFRMAQVRGRVVEQRDGDAAWAAIDEISRKYVGQPYPLRTDRVAYFVAPEHCWAMNMGRAHSVGFVAIRKIG